MDAKEVVTAYLAAMGKQDYASAKNYLSAQVKVAGPDGEQFKSPDGFLAMMAKFPGKYEIIKVIVQGRDVCALYDFIIPSAKVRFSSWYEVEEGKIVSIQSIFDPRPFAPPRQG